MQTASGYGARLRSFSSGAELPVGAEWWVYTGCRNRSFFLLLGKEAPAHCESAL